MVRVSVNTFEQLQSSAADNISAIVGNFLVTVQEKHTFKPTNYKGVRPYTRPTHQCNVE